MLAQCFRNRLGQSCGETARPLRRIDSIDTVARFFAMGKTHQSSMNKTVDSSVSYADLGMIKRMIPHRYPFLMIDKVIEMRRAESAVGIKNVTVNEPHFVGHFPDQPVMPGVAIIESMAQTAAILVSHTLDLIDKPIGIYLLALDNARFRKMVVPGDVLRLHLTVIRGRGKIWKFRGEGRVGEEVAAAAEITALWELKGAGA